MEWRIKPNSWVAQEATSTTQLTYALQVNPAPITVSIPGEDPVLASLEWVITNPTSAALAVQSVAFTLVVGDGASLTPTTAGITTAVSDPTTWTVVGPASPVTSGTATYTLEPVTGTDVSLDAGASVVVQLFQIQTNPTPGNSTIGIKEIVAGKPGFTNFQVTTFPTGFYFTGLIPTVQSGSALVPVAQITTGSTVTLVWNSSVVDTAAFTIYYSNAEQGQQTAKPSDVGEWTTGPLTSDTVFTAVVQVSVTGGQPLTAALMTSVAVQNPSLVAASINAGRATVSGAASIGGPLTANAITATGLTVNGTTSVGNFTSSGTVTVPGQSTLGTLSVTGQTTLGAVSAQAVNAASLSTSGNINASGTVIATNAQISFGQVVSANIGDSFTYNNQRMSWYGVGWFQDPWFGYGPTAWFSGYGGIKLFTGGTQPAFTIDYHGNCVYAASMSKASSIALKENVQALTSADAAAILADLDPVKYTLKAAPNQGTQMGFIAEHVHQSVASSDRKAIIPDQIVAVLTRVVKEQQQLIAQLEQRINALETKQGVNTPPHEE